MRQEGIIVVIAGVLLVGGILMFGMNRDGNTDSNNVQLERGAVTQEMPNEPMQNEQTNERSIVDIAVSDSQFSTLVTALQAAGLVETLSGEGPFTVFAPTNDAFAKLPAETLEEVLADKDQLTAILTYHVVAGKVMAEDVVNLTSADTVQGGELKIDVTGANVMVNNARVVMTDIEASNGVIHVIDTVLIPQ